MQHANQEVQADRATAARRAVTLHGEGKQGAGDHCAERTVERECRIAITTRTRLEQGHSLASGLKFGVV
jgi:hypothetical protein